MAGNRELPPENRVVVTGLGVVSSLGTGRQEFWQNLLNGTSGISPVKSFDTSAFSTHVGGEVKDFDPSAYIKRKSASGYGRTSQLSIAACRLAIEDSGIAHDDPVLSDTGLFMGTTLGEGQILEKITMDRSEAPDNIAIEDAELYHDNLMSLNASYELGLGNQSLVIPTACAAGNYAIGIGFDHIRSGRGRVVLAGGADSFSRTAFAGFSSMMALAREKCRPFDRNRDGILIGEGAGVLVLEAMSRAVERNARIYAELLGYGLTCDAYHMTTPNVEGVSAVMDKALRNAGVMPSEVSLINSHGTGTKVNDKTEYDAIRNIFGDLALTIPVNSIKSMLGHAMGAASALEAISCVLAIHDSRIPPTINFETPDEECPVNCVPNKMMAADVDVALNNSFAFGANNASTVFSKIR
jgi:3-oxoacyl-[acyl-carrier-protein] synthase II